jgi:integrase/recombinase XerD
VLVGRVALTGKGAKRREVPISGELVTELRALRREDDDESAHVFRSDRNKPMSRGTIWYVFKQAVDELVAENVPPYSLRHSFATHMIEDGVPVHVVQALLGHENLKTTSVYVHPPEDIAGAMSRIGPQG